MRGCVTMVRWLHVGLALLLSNVVLGEVLYGQAGLRESLEQLDKDQDGDIDPDEITPRARPYLERIAKARRMSLDRSNSIDRFQEAARIYYALQNGADDDEIESEGESSVKPFGPRPGEPLVPEFGLAEMKYAYIQEDLDEAERTLRRSDRNRDGYIDRAEAQRAHWTHRDPFEMDLDKDERLSRLELAQRYARRRLLSRAAGELVQKAWRTRNDDRSSDSDERRRRDESQSWRRGGNRQWLTATVLSRFDANRNGRLELEETQQLGIPSGRIDADRDGELTRDELQAYFEELQIETGGLSEGIPGWFYELDKNRDKQVAVSEFATEWSDAKLEEFALYDMNGDGLLTPAEVVQSKAMVGGSYRSQTAEMLPPRKTIISEIEISEDYLIDDLNVELSITHTHTSFLDGYLTGPDGQRVELFSEVGGEGDHFDQTKFDDQSRYPIVKARPPFRGTFLPHALIKKQPGLSQFNGKSVKGVWQLVIRGTRSDRFGMLHSWGLLVKPQEDGPLSLQVGLTQDGPQPVATSAGPVIPDGGQEVTKADTSPNEGKSSWESYRQAFPSKFKDGQGKIDYELVGKQIRDAVESGRLTEDQAKDKWAAIKAMASGKGKGDEGDKDDPRADARRRRGK